MKKNNVTTDLESRIGAMLRGESAPVPEDKWFVRKTMNRLPSRSRRLLSLPEILAFFIIITACAAIIVREFRTMVALPDPAEFSPWMLLSAGATALFATLYLTIPLLRRV